MKVQWVAGSNGTVPPNAVPGGRNDDGSTTYIGRVPFHGTVTPGEVSVTHSLIYLNLIYLNYLLQIVPKENVCYISFMGKEEESRDYEVLVTVDGGQTQPQASAAPVMGGMPQVGAGTVTWVTQSGK